MTDIPIEDAGTKSDLSVVAFLKLGALVIACFGVTAWVFSNAVDSKLRELELRMDGKYATKAEILSTGNGTIPKQVYELQQQMLKDENERQQKQIDRSESLLETYRQRIEQLERKK